MGSIREDAVIYAPAGTNRLRLLSKWEEGGGNFHSVVWEYLHGDEWRPHRTITQDEFQWGHPFRRWIAALHSLSHETGEAVIQVAEGDKPEPIDPLQFRGTRFIYTWRLWDLKRNRELKRLTNDGEPFDRYEPNSDES